MDVCVLASGSRGNSALISGGGVKILIDLGISASRAASGLRKLGVEPETLQGILVTHDHSDHYKGLGSFSRKFKVPLYANSGTAGAVDLAFPRDNLDWAVFETAQTFSIGGLEIDSFPVPHDAAEPVGYLVHEADKTLFFATDLGLVTPTVRRCFKGCDAAVLESNHDYEMLMAADRPAYLKSRICCGSGHLSNVKAADLVRECITPSLHHLMLAHLSGECNTPYLAMKTMRDALSECGRSDVAIEVLAQDHASTVINV